MDKYERGQHLGAGAFGNAYLCDRREDGATFVLKIVNAVNLSPQDKVESFREVQVLKKLAHPNIVRFEDAFKDGQNICIVMEHCEAGDLHARVASGDNISDQQKWDWFIQICKGLQHMHSSKVIHRDLKPSNIFISKDGSLRIGDFGLSKVLKHSAGLMNSSNAGCTLAYGAPDMLSGVASHKSDVWSLGCVLYFMVMGKDAFEAENVMQLVMVIAKGDYPAIPDTYSAEFRDMVGRLLTMDPEERPSISQVLNVPYISEMCNPTKRLQSVYGFYLKNGSIRDQDGNGYVWDRYGNKRANNVRFEGIAELLTEYLYENMLKLGMQKLPVPVGPSTDLDFDAPGTFIFASADWMGCEQLLIFIHGSGRVKAGQWAQRIMMADTSAYISMEAGTQLPYIRQALELGYGVIVMNTNDNKPDIPGCESPEKHGLYVWENYVQESSATQIAIKAHSAGGSVTSALYQNYEEDFRRRVYANAFTGVDPVAVPVQDYTKKVTRNWVTSDKPLGTVLPGSDRCECVSAGTTEHSETPHFALPKVFEFIQERFNDSSPGNL